ncbi:MAG: malto-oligosyltrehalose trehalohydrolase [Myxococcales bacterium]
MAARSAARQGRRRDQGAELVEGGVDFRIWAPKHKNVELLLHGSDQIHELTAEGNGYWSAFIRSVGAGTRYRYRIDRGDPALPDPAARYLPEGPHGPAEVVDPRRFAWTDAAWTGLPLHGHIIYEMHVGTFTAEGTWNSAFDKLPALKDLGVTVIEMMPVSEFPGRFGWGYDGVGWFAPSRLYGRPDDLRRFVDRAHQLGLGVIMDVVYNHLGPDGNYLERFAADYFSDQHNEWGRCLNFDGENSQAMRQLVIDNAVSWIEEYHMDGLRLDATQSIFDRSSRHVVGDLGAAARAAAGGRRLLITAENEPQDTSLLRSTELGGKGLDALWNDDFHHSATVALTGRRQAYYSDYQGTANEWLAAAKHGFLFQGQRSAWQSKRRGHAARGLPMAAFIAFLENHDQVANSLWSKRVWQQTSPAAHRAMTALLLLGPWTPLLFQGQEWNASTPFHYFADHHPELARLVREGRAEFMSQFPGCVPGVGRDLLPDPASPRVFQASKLNWDERGTAEHERALLLHKDLIALRRNDPTLVAHAATGVALEVSALSPNCGIIRYFVDGPVASSGDHDRLLVVNLGAGLTLDTLPEPLLAPPAEPAHSCWRTIWSSEDPRYGGNGSHEPERDDGGWAIPGCATVLLGPRPIV